MHTEFLYMYAQDDMQTAICMPVSLFCLWLIVMLLIDYSAFRI